MTGMIPDHPIHRALYEAGEVAEVKKDLKDYYNAKIKVNGSPDYENVSITKLYHLSKSFGFSVFVWNKRFKAFVNSILPHYFEL